MSALVEELRRAVPDKLVEAPRELAQWWIDSFRTRFVASPASEWWWEHLSVATKIHDYGDGDGLAAIDSIIQNWGAAVLILTDESSEPAGCVIGLGADLTQALRCIRNCEFVIARPDLGSWVFDTHLNRFHEYPDAPRTLTDSSPLPVQMIDIGSNSP